MNFAQNLRRKFHLSITNLHALATALCWVAFAGLAWWLWPAFSHWPKHWWMAAAVAWLASTLLLQMLLAFGATPRLASGWPAMWRASRLIVLCGVAVAGTGLWLQMQPARNGAHGMAQRFVCDIQVPQSDLDTATSNALLAPATQPVKGPLAKGKEKAQRAAAPTGPPGCKAVVSMDPNPPLGAVASRAGLATHTLVQCAAAGPRRCETLAWLNAEQAEQFTCASQCARPPTERALAGAAAKSDASVSAGGSSGGDKPGDALTLIATVLAVVLAVVTLIATKTASDARNEVRDEVLKLDAARQARGDAMLARAAMLASMLSVHLQQLSGRLRPGANGTADVTKLMGLLRPLIQLMYDLPGFASGTGDTNDVEADSGKVLDLLRMCPLRSLPTDLLNAPLRQVLRDMAQLIEAQADMLRQASRPPLGNEVRAWEQMRQVGALLADA